jgi:radical SAM protein with 4Fe4S-binding SPASM domain
MLIGEAECVFLSGLDFPGLSIQISLDGVSSRSHDQVRGEGAFNSALQGIARLVQYGLGHRISIFMTEMRHNLHEIPELLAFVDHRGLGSFSSGALVGCGRASGTLSEVLPPEPEQYLKLLERYDHDARFRELYGRFGTVAALEWRTSDAARKDCCTFVENPYLTPSGRLYPCLLCHADEYSVTGVFEKGLAAALAEGLPLWSELLRISLRRSEDCDECRNCRVKASCGAGCMGRAWGSFGDLVAADDRCRVRQAVRRYADDLIG